jgi:hypothetical protein
MRGGGDITCKMLCTRIYHFKDKFLYWKSLQQTEVNFECCGQVVTKICRLSGLTTSAFAYEPKCGGGGGGAGSQPISTAVHMEPK